MQKYEPGSSQQVAEPRERLATEGIFKNGYFLGCFSSLLWSQRHCDKESDSLQCGFISSLFNVIVVIIPDAALNFPSSHGGLCVLEAPLPSEGSPLLMA